VAIDSKEQVHVTSREEWRAWLEKNHRQTSGVWVVSFKKHTGSQHVPYDDIVEEALCFGWIDSVQHKLDDERSMLWTAPRKRGSRWSRLNKKRVEKLIAQGRMAEAGLEKIESAKLDGSWEALDSIEDLEIPPDLASAFMSYENAWQYFDAFPRSVKRGILEWISAARRPETRAARIEETARLADQNIRANQWRQ